MNYLKMLEHSFETTNKLIGDESSRLEYLSGSIFGFTTYDEAADGLFVCKAIEVCEAITNKAVYHYITTENNHIWYLLMCNMPFFIERIDWGVSIRGAWWDSDIELKSCGLWVDGVQSLITKFNRDQWEEFICAIIEFAKPELSGVSDYKLT